MEHLLRDLRIAFRALGRRHGFAAVVVVTLALAIGANSAIFSVVRGVLLAPPPYPEPDRMVDLTQSEGPRSTSMGAVSPRDLEDFKALGGIFAGLAGSMRDGKNVSFTGSPERLSGLAVEPGYFDVLGVHPGLGRGFAANEDEEGNDAVVILSHRLYERRFDSDPAVLARSILMDGRSYRIVGVMPGDFRTPEDLQAFGPIDYFVPGVIPADMRQNRGEHILDVVGRLQPGVTPSQANAALVEVAARVARTETGNSGMARAEVRLLIGHGVLELRYRGSVRSFKRRVPVVENDVGDFGSFGRCARLVAWREALNGNSSECAIRPEKLHRSAGSPCLMVFMAVTGGPDLINGTLVLLHLFPADTCSHNRMSPIPNFP